MLDPSSGVMCTRTALQFLFFEPYQVWLADERTFDVVIVGFASSLSLCTTPDDLERAQAALFGDAEPGVPREPGKPMRLAAEAFLPHGMFGAEGQLGARARARALLTGNVESVTLARNEITGSRFVHTRVRPLGGPIDIVAPADAVEVPERATLVVADCWLVGRPIEAPPKTGFFRRIQRTASRGQGASAAEVELRLDTQGLRALLREGHAEKDMRRLGAAIENPPTWFALKNTGERAIRADVAPDDDPTDDE